MYKRIIAKQIKEKFFKGKAIVITGARQTGKTTLALEILKETKYLNKTKVFNCDNPTDREMLNNKNIDFLIKLVDKEEVIFIDEGQKVETIGQTLKLLADHYKNKKQIVITGSSSLNLLDKTEEALTGRKFVFKLFPLSIEEIYPQKDIIKSAKELESLMIYGSYPEVEMQRTFADRKELLRELASSNLYRDILEFQEVKNSTIIMSLLKALALQIGNEVSYTELASLIGINKNTIEKYVDLLEKSYIIFRLPPYHSNKRREISKLRKIYFYDLGIRNSIINNFNILANRNDVWSLWENYLIIERIKWQNYHKIFANNYFWRTYDGAEVDFIEEKNGGLHGFEFKWGRKKNKPSAKWTEIMNSSYKVISSENYLDWFY